MGGAIALDYALRYPEDLAGLVLIGAGARLRVHPDYLNRCLDETRWRAEAPALLRSHRPRNGATAGRPRPGVGADGGTQRPVGLRQV